MPTSTTSPQLSAANPRGEDPAADPGAELMLAFQNGRESAFDELVERYAGPVYSLLTRFLGPVTDREDLVQEVFLRLLRAKDRYTQEARFTTYLYRIAFNLAANQRERDSHRKAESLEGGFEEEDGDTRRELSDTRAELPVADLERSDLVQIVQAAIAALPERQRMALVLAKYEGLPYLEIGRVLEISEQGVKSLIHRARETLRASLPASLLEEPA